jgi:hypothetical protein
MGIVELAQRVPGMDYSDRKWVLTLLGLVLLGAGLFAAFLAPIEMYCFYLFSEGGRFYYEGFGFGSFMFGNIASQIIGYYLIAAALIPLGYGHLRLRRWARPFSVALLWFWLVVGLPVILLFMAVLVSSKDAAPVVIFVALVFLVLSYALFPWLLIRFYLGQNVRLTFETRDPRPCWAEQRPMASLVLGALFLFFAVALHIPIFFNGVYPLFGTWLTGLPGIVALTVTAFCLAFLAWGILGQRWWAWWGALLSLGALTISAIVTLAASSYADLLAVVNFPPAELEFLDGLPFQGAHLALFAGLPLTISLVVLIFSKRAATSPLEY